MAKEIKSKINANGSEISIISPLGQEDDYICITDIAKYKNKTEASSIINNWMRSRGTIEFLGLWEKLNNSNFKPIEFERFKNESGSNSFVLSPQRWIEATNAIGIISKSGRYGGTYAHKDIAFEFASWISAEFKLYIITEYQRLKNDENHRQALEWNVNRVLSKLNYKIHTDAIKETLITNVLSKREISITYASEADVLNVALFGKTAKEWKNENPGLSGNIRDNASIEQLIVLVNLENFNASFIKQGLDQRERLLKLNDIARSQLKAFLDNKSINKLEEMNSKKISGSGEC